MEVFAFGSTYMDLPSLGALPKYTGGQLYYYPQFSADKDGPKLVAEVTRNLTRETGACVRVLGCLFVGGGWVGGWVGGRRFGHGGGGWELLEGIGDAWGVVLSGGWCGVAGAATRLQQERWAGGKGLRITPQCSSACARNSPAPLAPPALPCSLGGGDAHPVQQGAAHQRLLRPLLHPLHRPAGAARLRRRQGGAAGRYRAPTTRCGWVSNPLNSRVQAFKSAWDSKPNSTPHSRTPTQHATTTTITTTHPRTHTFPHLPT